MGTKGLKPGNIAPKSGQYEVVGPQTSRVSRNSSLSLLWEAAILFKSK